MTDLEKVINGLTCRLECGCMNEDHCNSKCPYLEDPRACYGLDEDALALLKAQEPRVMMMEEISSINGGDIVWIEDRSLDEIIAGIKFQSPSKNCYYVFLIGSKRPQPFSKELYKVNWRCWTSRPTDEQREAVNWE